MFGIEVDGMLEGCIINDVVVGEVFGEDVGMGFFFLSNFI